MRILYIHQFFATHETHLGLIRSYEFSKRLVEAGHQVTVVTSDSRLPEELFISMFAASVPVSIFATVLPCIYSTPLSPASRARATFKAGLSTMLAWGLFLRTSSRLPEGENILALFTRL